MRSRPAHSRGFTLIEVLISVAIVLILVAGINLIFGIASKAVGAGQALNDNSRSNQAAQGVMFNDFQNCADDSPYLIISSHAVPAFRNIDDMRGDRDYDPTQGTDTRGTETLTVDLDNNNTEGEASVPGEVISPVTVNNRNHRTDIVEFFSRGQNSRHTGNPGTYVANQSSNEALIWYGHLALPDNSGTFLAGGVLKTAPGQGIFGNNNNPNNFFSSQWIVGRQSILLNVANDLPPNDYIFDSGGTAASNRQNHLYDSNYWVPTGGVPATLWPLAINTPAKIDRMPDDASGQETIQFGRYDIADTSFDLFRRRLQRFIAGPPVPANWWSRLMASDANRFYADPLIAKPLTSAEFAKTAPVFLNSCSQFIVEFAGDFVTQDTANNSDQVMGNVGDGTIDYINKYVGPGVPPIRQIRWYGFPRNTDTSNDSPGAQFIPGTSVPAPPYFTAAIDSRTDVIPVRDMTVNGNTPMPFERVDLADSYNLLNEVSLRPANWETVAGVKPGSNYVCAWGPDTDAAGIHRPSLIRITYTLDDPSGRIAQGSTFEYVFKLK